MIRSSHHLRRDDGAETLEAALIYPIVLLIISSLIYFGVFILQYVSVASYADKIALLAAREVAFPGYIQLISGDSVSTGAIEIQLDDFSQAASSDPNTVNSVITIPSEAKQVHARAYRYWKSDPLDSSGIENNATIAGGSYNAKSVLENLLSEMVNNNSFLLGNQPATVEITCENYFITQNVIVHVDQQLMGSGFLSAVGVPDPAVHVSSLASANDTDEFIRNTDFVCDSLEMIARKLDIDVDSIRDKFTEIKDTLGLD